MLPSALSLLFPLFFHYFCSVIVKEKEREKATVKVCFFPLFRGILLCQVQRKTDLNGKDSNRLTEEKTGEDINRHKLEKEKEERRSQDKGKGRIIEE